MDFLKILNELRSELERTEQAIVALERLVSQKEKRRGRPPKWLQALRRDEKGAAAARTAGVRAPRK